MATAFCQHYKFMVLSVIIHALCHVATALICAMINYCIEGNKL